MTYAARTKVSVSQTEAEIKTLLKKYGADQIAIFEAPTIAKIAFTMRGRQIRFHVPLPENAQELRSRWRALLLVLKAKLESAETGIVTFEDEFLAHTVLPSGETAGEWMKPQIETAYVTQVMPDRLMLEGPKS